MLCQECKEREATVHVTKIINNRKTEMHLCEYCARQRDDFIQIPSFSVNDLIAGLMDFSHSQPAPEKAALAKCAACGMEYSQFKMGRLGCQKCYEYFGRELGRFCAGFRAAVSMQERFPDRPVHISLERSSWPGGKRS